MDVIEQETNIDVELLKLNPQIYKHYFQEKANEFSKLFYKLSRLKHKRIIIKKMIIEYEVLR